MAEMTDGIGKGENMEKKTFIVVQIVFWLVAALLVAFSAETILNTAIDFVGYLIVLAICIAMAWLNFRIYEAEE